MEYIFMESTVVQAKKHIGPSLKLKHYNTYIRERIIRLSKSFSNREICAKLEKEENFSINESGVGRFLNRFKRRHHLSNARKRGRPAIFSDANNINSFINEKMTENNELTGSQLSNMVSASLGIRISTRTINRIRCKLGWQPAHPKYCQIVRDVNKIKRLDFCSKLIKDISLLQKMIFTDESCIQLERHKRVIWRRKGEKLMTLRSRAKYPVKVHVWAGISWRGATQVLIMPDRTRINSQIYRKMLLSAFLPFITQYFPNDDYILQADSAPAHKSAETMTFIRERNINYDPTFWPPESPDLNAIENLWHELKDYLRGTIKPNNLSELKNGIASFWREKVTVDKCRSYIKHVVSVIPCVIENKGGPTLF